MSTWKLTIFKNLFSRGLKQHIYYLMFSRGLSQHYLIFFLGQEYMSGLTGYLLPWLLQGHSQAVLCVGQLLSVVSVAGCKMYPLRLFLVVGWRLLSIPCHVRPLFCGVPVAVLGLSQRPCTL